MLNRIELAGPAEPAERVTKENIERAINSVSTLSLFEKGHFIHETLAMYPDSFMLAASHMAGGAQLPEE
jgi:hypothetical protein